MIQLSMPLWLVSLINFVFTQADIWFISFYRSSEEIALYGAAVRLVQLVITPLLIVNAVLPPYISEYHAKGQTRALEKLLQMTSSFAAIPALLILLSFLLFPKPMLGLIYGEFYSAAAAVLVVLSIAQSSMS
ncbi:MAG: MATE family efflux transporter [Deinococcales bacterium]